MINKVLINEAHSIYLAFHVVDKHNLSDMRVHMTHTKDLHKNHPNVYKAASEMLTKMNEAIRQFNDAVEK